MNRCEYCGRVKVATYEPEEDCCAELVTFWRGVHAGTAAAHEREAEYMRRLGCDEGDPNCDCLSNSADSLVLNAADLRRWATE